MQIALRPAHVGDFDYCVALYFAEMERIIRELNLDRIAQATRLRERWDLIQVRVGQAVTLGVVKANPALRLYQRLKSPMTTTADSTCDANLSPDLPTIHAARK